MRELTRSIRDSKTSIDFVQGPPGSRRERVNSVNFLTCSLKILARGAQSVFLMNLTTLSTDQWRGLLSRRRVDAASPWGPGAAGAWGKKGGR